MTATTQRTTHTRERGTDNAAQIEIGTPDALPPFAMAPPSGRTAQLLRDGVARAAWGIAHQEAAKSFRLPHVGEARRVHLMGQAVTGVAQTSRRVGAKRHFTARGLPCSRFLPSLVLSLPGLFTPWASS